MLIQERHLSSNIEPEDWLEAQIKAHHDSEINNLSIPMKANGTAYQIEDLYDDQKYFAYLVLSKLKEWMTCDDLNTFKPLRVILNGQAGCGKSVVLNTISAVIRTFFQYNNTNKQTAPTGVSACNVGGETLQTFSTQKKLRGEYIAGSMSQDDCDYLSIRLKHLLCLIIDERSMVTSKLLGTTEQRVTETIYSGRGLPQHSWGGIPVVILAGDDYQLPGIQEGAFHVLQRVDGSKMTQRGRQLFRESANCVYKLPTVRRICDSQQADKDLMARLRTGNAITDADVEKLQSLHLDNIERKHGSAVVEKIKDQSVFLFWTNEKRIKHNIMMLSRMNTPENPTAILKPRSSGRIGKAISRHFDSDVPKSTLLCIGAKVSLQGRNFKPSWGLHNGACGTCCEIVFAQGQNPNHGALPRYVVVDFPQYTGPSWDLDNPTVRTVCVLPFSLEYLTSSFFPFSTFLSL